ncbi:Putative sodium-coupled neutral amino acid transporter 11 [Seminavis robusta]|uniref:Sodium-coupled neutral amino acid transporter 11 n=1 Tax=Seminavis robusta TaxID=568900 RepID=A0A9N8EA06_9STRA|nr:Putative sodium-coupled neutral amino acid transporter 11 [Seminavis robusta]|eukprot:Sro865_g212750.1 Putative sodium-coupled neutral amino acid transporter 11 (576) ;mRNA; r:3597-5401
MKEVSFSKTIESSQDYVAMADPGDGEMAAVPVDRPQPTRRAPKRMLSDIPEPKTRSGYGGAISNLINSIVGAGIIGIPYAFREAGLIVGLFLLVLVSYLTDKSLRIIIEAARYHPKLKMVGVKTYEDLMQIPYGYYGSLFVQVNMFILAYGAMVAYMLIIKDTVPTMFGIENSGGKAVAERELVMVITSLLIMLPLALLRDMASLSFTSFLSVTADVILVIFIALYSPIGTSVSEAGGFWEVLGSNTINSRLFIGLGVISTAMACQHSAFIVSGSMQEKTSTAWSVVTKYSLLIALVLCSLLGTMGFLGFLDETQGNILNNFDPDTVAANGARGLLAITMFFTYPMESFVARHVVAKIFFNGDSEGDIVDEHGNTIPAGKWLFCIGRRELIVIFLYILALIPALFVDDLGPVLSITGSLGGSCVAYIGPGLVYLGVHGQSFIEYTDILLGKTPPSHTDPTIELPVVGDASATIQTHTQDAPFNPVSKPWWWWLLGFPIWRAIASAGALGMRHNLEALEEESPGCTTVPPSGEVIGPLTRDYYIAMFFIIFGVIAVLVGLVTNIYVQIENTFYTPH